MSIQASSDENSTMNRVRQQSVNGDFVWQSILKDVSQEAKKEAILASFLHSTVLKHSSLEDALSFHIASKLASPNLSPMLIREKPRVGKAKGLIRQKTYNTDGDDTRHYLWRFYKAAQ